MDNKSLVKKLKRLFNEDQKDRNKPLMEKELDKKDEKRLTVLRKIIKDSDRKKFSPEELYYIAFLFHHSGNVTGSRTAVKYTKSGIDVCGSRRTKWCIKVRRLHAMSIDRLLMLQGKPQKFGTQYCLRKNRAGYESADYCRGRQPRQPGKA